MHSQGEDLSPDLLEYTDDPLLSMKIRRYCKAHGFKYYISDSLELDL